MEIKQPFSITDIKKYPTQILIAVLIIIMFYFVQKSDNESDEIVRLNEKIILMDAERIKLYEKVLFQGTLLEKSVSEDTLRELTEGKVKRILLRK